MSSLNKTTYDRLDLGAILAGGEQTCFRIAGLLDTKAKELAATGDADSAAVLGLLSEVCTYGLHPDNGRQPYGPRMSGQGWRTASIEDLNDAQLTFLDEIYATIAIPELRARVSDVLFVRRRHHKYGLCAIDSYLESASALMTPDDWVEASFRLERALVMTLSVRSERDRVANRIVDAITGRRVDSGYFTAKMMEALLDQRVGEAAVMAPLAEDAAKAAAAARDWDRAREYYGLLSQWRRRAGDSTGDEEARRCAANCYVEQATDAGSRSLEGAYLERAIQSLRGLGGTQAEVAKLHERLVAAEREALDELKERSAPVNLGTNPERARAHVAGQTTQQAIMRTSLLWRPEPVDKIRERTLAQAHAHVFLSVAPRVRINRQGKAVAKRGALLSGSDEERELALRQMMFETAQQQRDFITASTLHPARTQVAEEHYISYRDLMPFTQASVFVPPGREEPFAVGLAAGFNGDFATALHMLMPQFENAIRNVLVQNGTITSKIDEDGVQDERDLGWLLTCGDVEAVFGEDLVFDMRGLLIERFGSNLRNVMAHGLIEVDQMVGLASAYFWWLTLHLVIRPLLRASVKPGSSESVSPTVVA